MMKKLLAVAAIAALGGILSCQSDENLSPKNQISKDVADKIYNLGFSNQNVQAVEDGYIVEGDILLNDADLNAKPSHQLLRIAETEQYRTYNLVSVPRVIKVSISNKLPASYVAALDEALARYNALGISITFQRVSSGANISIVKGNGNYLASAGFPTSGGSPYNQVKVNSTAIGSQPQSTVASIIAHELGHCVGFRHTDYMDRSYSCGGSAVNEGASTVGAVQIPGTPSGPDSGSWVVCCFFLCKKKKKKKKKKKPIYIIY
jgi:hypothetical protein